MLQSALGYYTGTIGGFVRIAEAAAPKRATIRSIVRFSPTSHTMLTQR
jgi:hypothetical protein